MTRTDGALATQAQTRPTLQMAAGPVGLSSPRPSTKPKPPRAVQQSFVWEKPAGKVIPFEAFQSTTSRPRSKPPKSGSKGAARSRRTNYVHEGQGELDFLPPEPAKPRTLKTTVEAVVFCDDPVATRRYRVVASAFDWATVAFAYALFLLVYHLCGGEFLFDKASLMLIGGVLPLIGAGYGFVFAIAGYETPGMRWANLKLVTFEGDRPEPGQRLMRFLGACLSLCTVVGLLWTFGDEESLTWPDHISGTFPTPRKVDSQVFYSR